ncbi:hypothetical protein BJV74DRAFT_793125 [Russula compacta]|nr:hypothetical protein BJV74DRAFT_793125 [Russula compacta]
MLLRSNASRCRQVHTGRSKQVGRHAWESEGMPRQEQPRWVHTGGCRHRQEIVGMPRQEQPWQVGARMGGKALACPDRHMQVGVGRGRHGDKQAGTPGSQVGSQSKDIKIA